MNIIVADIYFNKKCLLHIVIPKYVILKINYNNFPEKTKLKEEKLSVLVIKLNILVNEL